MLSNSSSVMGGYFVASVGISVFASSAFSGLRFANAAISNSSKFRFVNNLEDDA